MTHARRAFQRQHELGVAEYQDDQRENYAEHKVRPVVGALRLGGLGVVTQVRKVDEGPVEAVGGDVLVKVTRNVEERARDEDDE